MIHIENKMDCCGCHACAQMCPKHCITMCADTEGFLYPQVDTTTCINCGACEKVCPIMQVQPSPEKTAPNAYAAINLDGPTRAQSSSGGVFTLLAERTIRNGGIVFGAAMAEDRHSVRHIAVETMEELAALRGSKYLQSTIGEVYGQVQAALRFGREVLFSGTPCQIEGLRAYLQKEDPNLLCVDIICHGVPSPRVWDTYLTEQETRAGAPARRTFFRHKKYGWKMYAVLLEFTNNTAYERIFEQDSFMQAFLRNACLRPSCFHCRFKKLNRVSDITLADYWGIQNQHPEMDDDKGTSLVLIHSAKGRQRIDALGAQLRLLEVPVEQALSGNPSMLHSVKPHRNRQQLFANLGKMEFDKLVEVYCQPETSRKAALVRRLKKMGLGPIIKVLKRGILPH